MLIRNFLLAMALAGTQSTPLGQVERDLTGDGVPEILRLVGRDLAADALDVTFTIESGGNIVYRFVLSPLTRTVGFDAGRRVVSVEEYRARLEEFPRWFFAESKFQRPEDFLSSLRTMAAGRVAEIPDVIGRDRSSTDTRAGDEIWREIRAAPITIFTFSPGGDEIVAIGWSERAGRFYRLLECC